MVFDKLDVTKDGKIEIDDLKARYNVQNHPDYRNGTRTEDEILRDFLSKFEQGGTIDGVVSLKEKSSEIAFQTHHNFAFQ